VRVPLRSISCALAAIAGCTESPRTSTQAAAIRGGSDDSGDPAIASLNVIGISYCTASLIAPRTLLTAGHCSNSLAGADFGPSESNSTQSIDITQFTKHPMYTSEGQPYDFALVQLSSEPTGITPLALNETALGSGDIGRSVRHVGFGVTDDSTLSGGGVKRTVTYSINKIDGMLVYSGAPNEQTCNGDSGGPGLVMATDGSELIASVVSDGPDCQTSQDGWDDRVDLVKDWIVSTTSGWDSPPTFADGGLAGSSSTDAGIDAPPAITDEPDGGNPAGSNDGSRHKSSGCSVADPSGAALLAIGLVLAARRRRANTSSERTDRRAG
jgi:MYXO-CTERM domain-containing protein